MKGLEILDLRLEGDCYRVRAALNGQLAIPFDIHKSVRHENFPADVDFESYIARQCRALIDAYGDAREQRPSPAAEFVV